LPRETDSLLEVKATTGVPDVLAVAAGKKVKAHFLNYCISVLVSYKLYKVFLLHCFLAF